MNKPDLKDVLTAVNIIRETWGEQTIDAIPAGFCNSPGNCPMANALSTPERAAECTTYTIYRARIGGSVWQDFDRFHMPVVMQDFIRAFDTGQYPELLIDTEPVEAAA